MKRPELTATEIACRIVSRYDRADVARNAREDLRATVSDVIADFRRIGRECALPAETEAALLAVRNLI